MYPHICPHIITWSVCFTVLRYSILRIDLQHICMCMCMLINIKIRTLDR